MVVAAAFGAVVGGAVVATIAVGAVWMVAPPVDIIVGVMASDEVSRVEVNAALSLSRRTSWLYGDETNGERGPALAVLLALAGACCSCCARVLDGPEKAALDCPRPRKNGERGAHVIPRDCCC